MQKKDVTHLGNNILFLKLIFVMIKLSLY